MDHKWGRNVLRYGLGGLRCNLAARVVGFPAVITDIPTGTSFTCIEATLVPPDTELRIFFNAVPRLNSTGRFPYGYNVEPDEFF